MKKAMTGERVNVLREPEELNRLIKDALEKAIYEMWRLGDVNIRSVDIFGVRANRRRGHCGSKKKAIEPKSDRVIRRVEV